VISKQLIERKGKRELLNCVIGQTSTKEQENICALARDEHSIRCLFFEQDQIEPHERQLQHKLASFLRCLQHIFNEPDQIEPHRQLQHKLPNFLNQSSPAAFNMPRYLQHALILRQLAKRGFMIN
jgi:hypothetical protein